MLIDQTMWSSLRDPCYSALDKRDSLIQKYRQPCALFGAHEAEPGNRFSDYRQQLAGRRLLGLFNSTRIDDIRQAEYRRDVKRVLQPMAFLKAADHRYILAESFLVDWGSGTPTRFNSSRKRDMTPRNVLFEQLPHLGIPSREGSGQFDAGIEEAMVDRTHFDTHIRCADHSFRRSEPGHAEDHVAACKSIFDNRIAAGVFNSGTPSVLRRN